LSILLMNHAGGCTDRIWKIGIAYTIESNKVSLPAAELIVFQEAILFRILSMAGCSCARVRRVTDEGSLR
jgi:hypothetical protein